MTDLGMKQNTSEAGALTRRYVVPPFTVLDGRSGLWLDRKRAWLSLGIEGEVQASGRAANLAFNTTDFIKANAGTTDATWVAGTSVFDPVLTECLIEWFCPQQGQILDPFAGGSVRGIVAAKLGRSYTGIELRPEQVAANEAQRIKVLTGSPAYTLPAWICGDSTTVLPSINTYADMILTCPPYGDLEVYGDNPADLSYIAKQDHGAFLTAYRGIVVATAARLRQDRFAVFVVGDYRDKKGFYRNFTGETVAAAEACGLHYYNEAILINPAGTLPIRVTGQMQASRKLGRCHQTVLVFVKGDPKIATQACLLNAPSELGCKTLPVVAVSKAKRSNASRDVGVGIAAQLQDETPVSDGCVGVEDSSAVIPEAGKLGSNSDGGMPITAGHVTTEEG